MDPPANPDGMNCEGCNGAFPPCWFIPCDAADDFFIADLIGFLEGKDCSGGVLLCDDDCDCCVDVDSEREGQIEEADKEGISFVRWGNDGLLICL